MPEVRLGRLAFARSGDKGNTANVGVIAISPSAYEVILREVTSERVKRHFKGVCRGEVERFELPNLLALNFVVKGLLGDGVAASLRSDPQAKSLGEYLRAKVVPIPASLLTD